MTAKPLHQKWQILEQDDYVVIIPNTDTRPHGTRISDTRYELTLECACRPKIMAGQKGKIFAKPIVLHNSFQDTERINISSPGLQ